VNAGRSTTTTSSGSYSLTGLLQSRVTVNISAGNYVSQWKGLVLLTGQPLSFQLTPTPALRGL
jgi:hypothetical protein